MVAKSKQEYLAKIKDRYRHASKERKGIILDEFCEVCGQGSGLKKARGPYDVSILDSGLSGEYYVAMDNGGQEKIGVESASDTGDSAPARPNILFIASGI